MNKNDSKFNTFKEVVEDIHHLKNTALFGAVFNPAALAFLLSHMNLVLCVSAGVELVEACVEVADVIRNKQYNAEILIQLAKNITKTAAMLAAAIGIIVAQQLFKMPVIAGFGAGIAPFMTIAAAGLATAVSFGQTVYCAHQWRTAKADEQIEIVENAQRTVVNKKAYYKQQTMKKAAQTLVLALATTALVLFFANPATAPIGLAIALGVSITLGSLYLFKRRASIINSCRSIGRGVKTLFSHKKGEYSVEHAQKQQAGIATTPSAKLDTAHSTTSAVITKLGGRNPALSDGDQLLATSSSTLSVEGAQQHLTQTTIAETSFPTVEDHNSEHPARLSLSM